MSDHDCRAASQLSLVSRAGPRRSSWKWCHPVHEGVDFHLGELADREVQWAVTKSSLLRSPPRRPRVQEGTRPSARLARAVALSEPTYAFSILAGPSQGQRLCRRPRRGAPGEAPPAG